MAVPCDDGTPINRRSTRKYEFFIHNASPRHRAGPAVLEENATFDVDDDDHDFVKCLCICYGCSFKFSSWIHKERPRQITAKSVKRKKNPSLDFLHRKVASTRASPAGENDSRRRRPQKSNIYSSVRKKSNAGREVRGYGNGGGHR
ncbi:hypothetical protein FQR65_LT02228 [Abscondita terminalis]|nr:hypothetical protein FQR65_LT02228 [Abscondita terminalis]